LNRVVAILTCIGLAACSTARPEQPRSVDPGSTVALAVGETAVVRNADVKIRFAGVTEDSRCPRDVECVWAGQVKIQLEIRVRTLTRVEVSEGDSTPAGPYRVTLVRLEPQPLSNVRIAMPDYRATLKLD
jgi:hypothetical protein